ncbi:integrase core domain-containing protein [Cerasicoccus frondis]|uniref:integrase core domain-containing protein n=1 Tax=Cerasicoccus frondis TaxID=490090 RepID=UPI003CCCB705
MQGWLKDNEIKTIYIDPGCPWQNGFVESFNDKFRRECLNRELIYTLSESRVIFDDYRQLHNHERPHRSLGLLTPAQFAKQQSTGSGSVRPTASLRQNLNNPTNPVNNNPTGILS